MKNPRPRVKITSAVECPILDSVYSVLGTRALDSCVDTILYVHTTVPYLHKHVHTYHIYMYLGHSMNINCRTLHHKTLFDSILFT